MKKTMTMLTLLVWVLVLLTSPISAAETVNFTVSANLPFAKGVSIVATEINGLTHKFGDGVSDLDFDPLSYDDIFGIWRSGVYFAIDVGATDGAGSPAVDVSYGSESSPSGQAKGLGYKSTASFTLVTGGPAPEDQDEADLTAHGPIKLLNQLMTVEKFTKADLSGGFLRIRVGLYDGGDEELNWIGGEPFTNADVPGPYSGILTVTATVD